MRTGIPADHPRGVKVAAVLLTATAFHPLRVGRVRLRLCELERTAGRDRRRGKTPLKGDEMSGLDWGLTFALGILYVALVFTVAIVTFRKGHWVMGLIGFFFPILWLIGAILPPTRRR